MSFAARLPGERLARRAVGRLADGDPPRTLLSWLLLGPDGPPLRRWRHEPPLDRRSCRSRGNRKTCAQGRIGRTGAGRRNDWLGRREIGLEFAVVVRLVRNECIAQAGISAFGANVKHQSVRDCAGVEAKADSSRTS
jgi:hypothetical protein